MSAQPQDEPTPQDAPLDAPLDMSLPDDVEVIDPFVAAYGEAAGEGRFLPAFGKHYQLRDKQPAMVMLKFSKLAAKGMKTDDPAGGAALYDLLQSVFTPDAWTEFEQDAMDTGADMDELNAILAQAVGIINGFPTTPSSSSLPGQPSTTPSSTVVADFEDRKRSLGLVPVTPESVAELLA